MKALLLAGGYGSRLKPFTDLIPKCMMPINGRPLLDFWLEKLCSNEAIDRVLVNTHYKSELVSNYLKDCTWNSKIDIAFEPSLLGTAGTILKNESYFGNKEFFVAHADNFSIFDLDSLIHAFHKKESHILMTMMAFNTDRPENAGILELNNSQEVIRFHEKTHDSNGTLANGAVFIIDHSVIDFVRDLNGDAPDISVDLIPKLLGKINVFINEDRHIDIGTLRTWNLANMHPVQNSYFNPSDQKLWLNILSNL